LRGAAAAGCGSRPAIFGDVVKLESTLQFILLAFIPRTLVSSRYFAFSLRALDFSASGGVVLERGEARSWEIGGRQRNGSNVKVRGLGGLAPEGAVIGSFSEEEGGEPSKGEDEGGVRSGKSSSFAISAFSAATAI
jgi:hypothetical protein